MVVLVRALWVRESKGGLPTKVSIKLPRALISHESGVAYHLDQESTLTSTVELLHNHIFKASLDIIDTVS